MMTNPGIAETGADAPIRPTAIRSVIIALAALAAAAAMLTAAGPLAAEPSAEECAEITDDAERLACFDRIFRAREAPDKPAPEAAPEAREAEPARPAAPVREAEPPPAVEAPAARREEPARPAEPAEPAEPADRFGLEGSIRYDGPSTITSVAVGEFDHWERGMDIELENGQVWRVVNARPLFYKAENPEVFINRRFLGAYYLGFEDVHQRLRVQRIR